MNLRALAIISVTLGLIFLAYKVGQSGQTKTNSTSELPKAPTVPIAIDRSKLEYPRQVKEGVLSKKAPLPDGFVIRGKLYYRSPFAMFVGDLKNVNLTPDQVAQMQDVYNIVFEARVNYESSKARVGQVGSSTVVEIPSYEAFGTQLRAAMLSTFGAILGKDTAAAVNEQLGSRFDSANAYWGKYPQTVQGDYDEVSKVYKITHIINPTPNNPDDFRQEFDSVLPGDKLDIYSAYFPALQGK